MSACKTFSKNFPTAKLKGCQFYFAQNIWRQLKKKSLIPYWKDNEVRHEISNILVFSLLPLEEIHLAFADVIEDLSQRNEKCLQLTDNIVGSCMEEG